LSSWLSKRSWSGKRSWPGKILQQHGGVREEPRQSLSPVTSEAPSRCASATYSQS
jgi:hypothetical protein